jgi:hypothetical protein
MIRPFAASMGLLLSAVGLAVGPAYVQDRDTKVRTDRAEVQDTGLWIYNDLSQGIAQARKTGKPLLVVFRCIP